MDKIPAPCLVCPRVSSTVDKPKPPSGKCPRGSTATEPSKNGLPEGRVETEDPEQHPTSQLELSVSSLFPQFCGAVHIGRQCGWWPFDHCRRGAGHLCVAAEAADQKEEDFTPPAAGERGGGIMETANIKYFTKLSSNVVTGMDLGCILSVAVSRTTDPKW